ncbi:lipopolysaccharide transport periplasmic protein LptA [Glaciecola sp. KUL10]|uniref:lipopolysaccharide transport periplasmic protein LptA n=1 Tax=Glaciecola sp. (strain KUL10) TaxID=2161813 RepID=UPI001F2C52E1|nr:lipopolysaccharide transport periplasmic protein LptA [Glaciecola sp. KUL10]
MFKLNIAHHVKRCLLVLSVIALNISAMSGAFAQQADTAPNDFEQPIRVKSDEQFVDAKMKTSVFEKNVMIRQGSLLINAEYVKVDAINGKGKEVFTIKGLPASYTQRLADGSNVEARARQIIYDIGTRTIALEGDAELIQNASTVKGDSIIFDMQKEQMRAQGNSGNDEQVETIFTPESSDDEGEPKGSVSNSQGNEPE